VRDGTSSATADRDTTRAAYRSGTLDGMRTKHGRRWLIVRDGDATPLVDRHGEPIESAATKRRPWHVKANNRRRNKVAKQTRKRNRGR